MKNIIFILACVFFLVSCGSDSNADENDPLSMVTHEKHKGVTIGDAFDVAFDNGKWSVDKLYGKDVVIFKGNISQKLYDQYVSYFGKLDTGVYSPQSCHNMARTFSTGSFIPALNSKYKCKKNKMEEFYCEDYKDTTEDLYCKELLKKHFADRFTVKEPVIFVWDYYYDENKKLKVTVSHESDKRKLFDFSYDEKKIILQFHKKNAMGNIEIKPLEIQNYSAPQRIIEYLHH